MKEGGEAAVGRKLGEDALWAPFSAVVVSNKELQPNRARRGPSGSKLVHKDIEQLRTSN